MAILADCHMHSSFSGDSETPMEEMADRACSIGLKDICFTEHMDLDYPEGTGDDENCLQTVLKSICQNTLIKYRMYKLNIQAALISAMVLNLVYVVVLKTDMQRLHLHTTSIS